MITQGFRKNLKFRSGLIEDDVESFCCRRCLNHDFFEGTVLNSMGNLIGAPSGTPSIKML